MQVPSRRPVTNSNKLQAGPRFVPPDKDPDGSDELRRQVVKSVIRVAIKENDYDGHYQSGI
jgi:hypothetical protein